MYGSLLERSLTNRHKPSVGATRCENRSQPRTFSGCVRSNSITAFHSCRWPNFAHLPPSLTWQWEAMMVILRCWLAWLKRPTDKPATALQTWPITANEPNRISQFLAMFSGLTNAKALTFLDTFKMTIDSHLTKLARIGQKKLG